MARREAVPRWLLLGALIALGANILAAAMTQVTIDLMRSTSAFATEVHERDLALVHYYQALVYPIAALAVVLYLGPIIRHFRCDPDQPAAPIVQRRTVNAPLVIAAIGFLPWTISAVAFPLATLITFGRRDMVTSTRFADPLKNGISHSEVVVFEGCAHAPIYEKIDEFNARTLAFLQHHSG